MSVLSIRITLIICHIFITLLWAITSRGRNTANFFGLFRQTKSIPIVLFECFGFAQVLLLPYLAFSMKTESMPTVKLIGLLLALFGTLLASWQKSSWGETGAGLRSMTKQYNPDSLPADRLPTPETLFMSDCCCCFSGNRQHCKVMEFSLYSCLRTQSGTQFPEKNSC